MLLSEGPLAGVRIPINSIDWPPTDLGYSLDPSN